MSISSSILIDTNNETWLAVEGNVIRVFTTKTSAVQYRTENQNKQIAVLHRYPDGSLQPLLFWGNQEFVENDRALMDSIEDDYYFDGEDGYDDDIDFYNMCSGAANDATPATENKDEH